MNNLPSVDGRMKGIHRLLEGINEFSDLSTGIDDAVTDGWDDLDLSDIGVPEPDTPIPLSELLEEQLEPLTYLVDSLLALGFLILLAGRPKSGKSWLMMMLAKCVDLGEEFLRCKTTSARVLYIALEDGQRRVQQRAKTLGWIPKHAALTFTLGDLTGQDGETGPGIGQLKLLAQDYDLIIIDTLVAALSGSTNENNNVVMGKSVNRIAQIAHETNTAIVLVHHVGKADYDDPFKSIRGASAIRGSYDIGLVLKRRTYEREAILHVESRDFDIQDMTLRQDPAGAGWEYIGKANALERIRSGRETVSIMLELDPEGNGLTAKQIAQARKVSPAAVYKGLNRLVNDGYVKRQENQSTGEGKISDLWLVVPEIRESLQE